jgi:hypothetical protein
MYIIMKILQCDFINKYNETESWWVTDEIIWNIFWEFGWIGGYTLICTLDVIC